MRIQDIQTQLLQLITPTPDKSLQSVGNVLEFLIGVMDRLFMPQHKVFRWLVENRVTIDCTPAVDEAFASYFEELKTQPL